MKILTDFFSHSSLISQDDNQNKYHTLILPISTWTHKKDVNANATSNEHHAFNSLFLCSKNLLPLQSNIAIYQPTLSLILRF